MTASAVFFYGPLIMATDVDVQYFSHLNGLVLGNNWGDLIRLLDKALVTGIDFTQITAASIDEQGDVSITLFAAHNARNFQVVELSGFVPNSLNQKYRIKGVPSTTRLILKPQNAITETSISLIGSGKLASLGYDIIFRDTNDVKRVYRAKNPTAQHPFIRVDESLASPDGTSGIYTSSYAKYAMVGLLEKMKHIDDYENLDVLQLPLSTASPGINYNISGVGGGVNRGWSKWYFANRNINIGGSDSSEPVAGSRFFTLCGDRDAFYLVNSMDLTQRNKLVNGCGLFNSALEDQVIPSWFLMTSLNRSAASTSLQLFAYAGGISLNYAQENSCFFTTRYSPLTRISNHVKAYPIMPDYQTGNSSLALTPSLVSMEIPFYDELKVLRGNLKHVNYIASTGMGNISVAAPRLFDSSMYVYDSTYNPTSNASGVSFYLGELD